MTSVMPVAKHECLDEENLLEEVPQQWVLRGSSLPATPRELRSELRRTCLMP
jgi:hypothetical protein